MARAVQRCAAWRSRCAEQTRSRESAVPAARCGRWSAASRSSARCSVTFRSRAGAGRPPDRPRTSRIERRPAGEAPGGSHRAIDRRAPQIVPGVRLRGPWPGSPIRGLGSAGENGSRSREPDARGGSTGRDARGRRGRRAGWRPGAGAPSHPAAPEFLTIPREKERPETPAQLAPPVGGREDGTSRVRSEENGKRRGFRYERAVD